MAKKKTAKKKKRGFIIRKGVRISREIYDRFTRINGVVAQDTFL